MLFDVVGRIGAALFIACSGFEQIVETIEPTELRNSGARENAVVMNIS
jgi:hypothetical protein